MFMFGSELYWKHIRLVVMSHAKIFNPVLEMHESQMTYDEMKLAEATDYKMPWSYMINMLAGQDPDMHASMYELALASKLFKSKFVCLLDYGRQSFPGGTEAVIGVPLVTIEDGVIGSRKYGDTLPNTDGAFWMLNSYAGKNQEGVHVCHWDVIESRVVIRQKIC